jgi:hypothetical protein
MDSKLMIFVIPHGSLSPPITVANQELLQKNPITLVRQSAKRIKTPDILHAEKLQKLLF